MLLGPLASEFGHGAKIPIRHPDAHLDLSALRVRPHSSRSHAAGLEQVSMQELCQAVSKWISERTLISNVNQ